jgi:3,4-dihydroxy 2-butanone 4-phosphate synthase / GTP cyclohydrolase II
MSGLADAIRAIGRGEVVIVTDDEDRENEGDLMMAAEAATTEKLAFFLEHTSGIVCTALPGERLDELELPLMVAENRQAHQTAFTVKVDLAAAITTGVSAADRARTIRALADPHAVAADFVRPGHVFPLRSRPNGVLDRPGHTEASVDLARRRHGIFTAQEWRSPLDGVDHVAFLRGDVSGGEPVLTRVHSECLTGDVFGSRRCDCGSQLDDALPRSTRRAAASSSICAATRAAASASAPRCAPTSCRTTGTTPVDANLHLGLPVDSREATRSATSITYLETTRRRMGHLLGGPADGRRRMTGAATTPIRRRTR